MNKKKDFWIEIAVSGIVWQDYVIFVFFLEFLKVISGRKKSKDNL